MSRLPTLAVVLASLSIAGCGRANAPRVGDVGDAAEKVYVAPGKYDEFYAFLSGGFDGQVGVYGLPSGRLLRHVPVFSQNPENGWGYSEQTKAMLQQMFADRFLTLRFGGAEIVETNMDDVGDGYAEKKMPFLELINGTIVLPEELYAVVRP